jgi:hypothetical protein
MDALQAGVPGMAVGLMLVVLAFLVYVSSAPDRYYNHFVWQALAFLQGRAAIDWPVYPTATSAGNYFFQDVLPVTGADGGPTGTALMPFPPLPAIVLMPFAAIWGIATDERVISVALGALDVGLAWWMLGRIRVGTPARIAATAFFAFGTAMWYAAQLGTTWFFAHVVAMVPALLAVGIALGGDPDADGDAASGGVRGSVAERLRVALAELPDWLRAPVGILEPRQVAAGFLFGLACTARLSIVFGAPFFVFVGSGGSWVRRAASAGFGAALPIGALLVYNLSTTGHLIHPAYEYLYQLEAYGWPGLNYHADWGIEDLRYLPQNLEIMLLSGPVLLPSHVPSALGLGAPLCVDTTVRGLFSEACPLALPRDTGMSILLTSPAYLLALPLLGRIARSRLVVGAAVAVGAIAFFNLMHFSQGWVQFGYRFSLDFLPFALPLVALGMGRRPVGLIAFWLVVLSIAVNYWGVTWGNLLGW